MDSEACRTGAAPQPTASAHSRSHSGKYEGRIAGDHGDDADGRREPARSLHLRLAEERRMTALFADTFYWIALADSADSAHRRALELTSKLVEAPIVTTDEVLAEYLTFFATAYEQM